MNRIPFALISLITAALSLTVVVVLLMPVKFYRAKNPVDDAWTVQITWSNLLCNAPQPNLNVSNDKVHEFWGLAKNARLSERMTQVGKCVVGVKMHNGIYPDKVNVSVCYCVNNVWVPMVTLISSLTFMFSMFDLLIALIRIKTKQQSVTYDEMRGRARLEMIRNVFFGLTLIVYAVHLAGEFTYIEYGHIYPGNFYAEQPTQWRIAFWIHLAVSFLTTVHFFAFAIFGKRAANDEAAAAIKKKQIENRKSATIAEPKKVDLFSQFHLFEVDETYSRFKEVVDSPKSDCRTIRQTGVDSPKSECRSASSDTIDDRCRIDDSIREKNSTSISKEPEKSKPSDDQKSIREADQTMSTPVENRDVGQKESNEDRDVVQKKSIVLEELKKSIPIDNRCEDEKKSIPIDGQDDDPKKPTTSPPPDPEQSNEKKIDS